MAPRVGLRSLPAHWPRRWPGSLPQFRDDRPGRVHLVADGCAGNRVRREIQIDARAEPDETVTLASRQPVTRLHVAEDTTRDQPGNLHAGDLGAGRCHELERIALVVHRRLVERRVDEAARVIPPLGDSRIDRASVRMHVEDVHEHADHQCIATEIRIARVADAHDAPVGRRQHRVRISGHVSRRVTKELEDEKERDPGERGERPPRRGGQCQRNAECRQQKCPAFARDDRMRITSHGRSPRLRCSFPSAARSRSRNAAGERSNAG